MNRREFVQNSVAGSILASSSFVYGASPKDSIVVDAMGEIRSVYTNSLVREMIDSGLNAITVTLCDPKSYESEAYEMAMQGIEEYDRCYK